MLQGSNTTSNIKNLVVSHIGLKHRETIFMKDFNERIEVNLVPF